MFDDVSGLMFGSSVLLAELKFLLTVPRRSDLLSVPLGCCSPSLTLKLEHVTRTRIDSDFTVSPSLW